MKSLDLVNLIALMKLNSGEPEITIRLIDGPVVVNHPDLAGENIREVPRKLEMHMRVPLRFADSR